MRYLFLVAGLLSLATGIIHALMGGIETLNPLMASTLAMEVRVSMMAVWHGLTVVFILSTLAFFWAFRAGRERARPVGILLGCFLSAVCWSVRCFILLMV